MAFSESRLGSHSSDSNSDACLTRRRETGEICWLNSGYRDINVAIVTEHALCGTSRSLRNSPSRPVCGTLLRKFMVNRDSLSAASHLELEKRIRERAHEI